MFLMTRGAGAVLDNVRLVERVLRVTGFAALVDRLEGDAVAEPIAHHFLETDLSDRTAGH